MGYVRYVEGVEVVGHVGWFGCLFADGRVSSGWGPEGLSVSSDVLGRLLPVERWETRPASGVVGWVMTCECGWRGTPIARVADRHGAGLPLRRFAADEHGDPVDFWGDPVDVDDLLGHPEWSAHVDFVLAASVTTR